MSVKGFVVPVFVVLVAISLAVFAQVPPYQKVETQNAIRLTATGFRIARGFYNATCYVGYEGPGGDFSPDGKGMRTITIRDWPENFLLRDLNARIWTRIRATENTEPLMNMSVIIEAYWQLLLREHLLNDTSLADIVVTTHIEPYADDMIALLSVSPQGPVLSVAPTTLDLGSESSGTIQISNTGVDTLTWVGSSLGARLSVSPPNGNVAATPQDVVVTADRSGLPAGSYSVDFTVASNGGSQVVTVTVVITVPVLELSTTSLHFAAVETEKTFTIQNAGEAQLTWNLVASDNRITFSESSGTTTTEVDTVTVYVDRAGLAPGSYPATITVQSNAGDQVINVIVVVA